MSDIQEFLRQTKEIDDFGSITMQAVRPRIFCNDGESVSIQAGRTAYCKPRVDTARHYTHVEAGYPSVVPPLSWKEYAEEWDQGLWDQVVSFIQYTFGKCRSSFMRRVYWDRIKNPMPTQTVYGYMPIETAQDFIDEHGGIDWGKTLLGEHTDKAKKIVSDFKEDK